MTTSESTTSDLIQAVERFAEIATNMRDYGIWDHLQCIEVEAIADILRAAGHPEIGAEIVRLHVIFDEADERINNHNGR